MDFFPFKHSLGDHGGSFIFTFKIEMEENSDSADLHQIQCKK